MLGLKLDKLAFIQQPISDWVLSDVDRVVA